MEASVAIWKRGIHRSQCRPEFLASKVDGDPNYDIPIWKQIKQSERNNNIIIQRKKVAENLERISDN